MDEPGRVADQVGNRRAQFVGLPRPAGSPAMNSSAAGPVASVPGVRITPGLLACTRTPRGPNSADQERVRDSTAPLVDE
jgi:hypothetical protein